MSTQPRVQLVIFGGNGDLAMRKLMPALIHIYRENPVFSVFGAARGAMSDDEYRAAIRGNLPDELQAGFDALAPNVFYKSVDVSKPSEIDALKERLDEFGPDSGRLYYLSLKPSLFGPTVRALHGAGLIDIHKRDGPWRRVVIEKPFGHDLESAQALNAGLHRFLREDQIYRIDHYLGKETVQNLLGFRFHNAIFEPLWNHHHIELVQITVAEELGMAAGRGAYYDDSGAIRDMLQNHMLQILSLVAMEAPPSLEAEAVRAEKIQVLRSLVAYDPTEVKRNVVRARYVAGKVGDTPVRGYLEEEGVAPDSTTETYVACRAEIHNWRWSGVPFLLRHGKRLPKKFTSVEVQFRVPPVQLFNRPDDVSDHEFRRMVREGSICRVRPNRLTLSIQPHEAIHLSFGVKMPGAQMTMAPAKLSFDYKERFGNNGAPAYERLLLDALQGDPTLFLHADEVAASWRFADSLYAGFEANNSPLHTYAAGSWGPDSADELFYGCEGSWSRG
jgi:glucose-6-phosphate 1-dehydrogenase